MPCVCDLFLEYKYTEYGSIVQINVLSDTPPPMLQNKPHYTEIALKDCKPLQKGLFVSYAHLFLSIFHWILSAHLGDISEKTAQIQEEKGISQEGK